MSDPPARLNRTHLAAGLLLGMVAGIVLFTTALRMPGDDVVSVKDRILSLCLGRRSKAQRLAYWKEQSGIDLSQLPVFDGPANVTFSRDIAPIVFKHCAQCHRPGEVTPFSVLTFADIQPWAWLIGIVTANRYMPPWPPGFNPELTFKGERRLPDEDIVLIRQWLEEGAVEGDPADLPPIPEFPDDWQLGEPDLVVELAVPYTLPALAGGGETDSYRNLVLPILIERSRWVKAVEIRPGNKRVVHHAIMQIDRLQTGRRLDAAESAPGFAGMDMGSTENPGGHFIGWAPGKEPIEMPDGMPWRITPGTDLILQLHMLPSEDAEQVIPQIGLYFTDEPARRQPFGLVLRNGLIDIPAGTREYVVEESVIIPVDLEVLGIFPHAHYLGRDVKAIATLPDGTQTTLIHIKDWDFGWQDEYRYKEPIRLPAGTRVSMRFSYDNSAENPHNPHKPPRRVVAGNRSSDEMAIVVLQVLTDDPADESQVREAVARSRLQTNPDGWFSHNLLGIALRAQGRSEEAIEHFFAAERLNPDHPGVIYNLANAYQSQGDLTHAIQFYERVLVLDPKHPKAHNNLAIALQSQGNMPAAVEHFRTQLELSPSSARARYNLATALTGAGEKDEALAHLTRALEIDPTLKPAKYALADLLLTQTRFAEAQNCYADLLSTDPDDATAHFGKARAHLALGEERIAIESFEHALSLDPELMNLANNLAWELATNPEKSVRRPSQAVLLAELIDVATGHQVPEVLDTLAAAHAAAGQFETARTIIKRALALAGANHVYATEFNQRLSLYEQGKAFISSGG